MQLFAVTLSNKLKLYYHFFVNKIKILNKKEKYQQHTYINIIHYIAKAQELFLFR